MRGLLVQPEFMRRLARLQIRVANLLQRLGRHLARADVDFLLRELREDRLRQAQVAAQNVRGGAGDPICNAEGAELGKMAIVEAQQKMAFARSQALNGMAVPARKIPRVAGLEFGNLGLPVGRNHGSTATSGEDI